MFMVIFLAYEKNLQENVAQQTKTQYKKMEKEGKEDF